MADEKDDDLTSRRPDDPDRTVPPADAPPPADGPSEHPAVHYEKRDVPFRGVLAVILAAICLGGVQLYLVWVFFLDQQRHEEQLRASHYSLAPPPTLRLPAEPRLEQLDRITGIESPNVYLREQSREQLLRTYGSTDEKGYIHVPIRRAMERVVGDLPVRKQVPRSPAKDNGLIDAGEPNSGRMFRGTPQ